MNGTVGTVNVVAGDLIFVVFCQQTTLTATAVTDNLGNTYTAQNAGTDAGAVTGRGFYSVVTVPGVLLSVIVAATASSNDWCGLALVLNGPVTAIDTNPANITTDVTSPYTCPATGTLAQAEEIIIAWGVANYNVLWTATSPNRLGVNLNQSTLIKGALGYQAVNATTTVSPVFAAASNPTQSVLGTCSFKRDMTQHPGTLLLGNTRNALQWVGSGQ